MYSMLAVCLEDSLSSRPDKRFLYLPSRINYLSQNSQHEIRVAMTGQTSTGFSTLAGLITYSYKTGESHIPQREDWDNPPQKMGR